MKAGWSSVRFHGGSKTATFANRPAGALDSGGTHCNKTEDRCLSIFLLTRATAHGIIVPLLYTANDAKKIVQAAKFPPVGSRGFGS